MSGGKEITHIRVVQSDSKTKFPMISFPNLPFEVMLLPFTRVQLEFFLCAVNDIRFDTNWYTKIVSKGNPRTSPNQVNRDNILGIFTTNVLLKEARRIADWYGHHEGKIYDIPTAKQWSEFITVCRQEPPFSLDELPSDLDPRARILVQRLSEIYVSSCLADQMLLGREINEYVYKDSSRRMCQITGGRSGEFTSLIGPLEQIGNRQPNLSFRLVRQEL